jgi:hypothetical protein
VLDHGSDGPAIQLRGSASDRNQDALFKVRLRGDGVATIPHGGTLKGRKLIGGVFLVHHRNHMNVVLFRSHIRTLFYQVTYTGTDDLIMAQRPENVAYWN